jgi:hypothetical protein
MVSPRRARFAAGCTFMVSGKYKAAIEFLHFLADVSDPTTGAISPLKLAAWLGMTEDALLRRWTQRGPKVTWKMFADELLAVLDAAQSQGVELERVIEWYFNAPIEQSGSRTADQLVLAGEARWLVRQLDTYNVWAHVAPNECPRRPLS